MFALRIAGLVSALVVSLGLASTALAASTEKDSPEHLTSYAELTKMKPMDLTKMTDNDEGFVTKEACLKLQADMWKTMDKDDEVTREEWRQLSSAGGR